MRFLLLALCILIYQASGFLWYRTDYDSPEEQALFPFLEALADDLNEIIFFTVDNLPVDELQQMWIMDEVINSLDLSANASSGCRSCVVSTALLKTTVQSGVSFEEIRPIVLEICYNISGEYNPDLLCAGAIDNWGPHIVYILNTTQLVSEEICLKMNNCQPDDLEPGTPIMDIPLPAAPEKPAGPKHQRRRVSLNEAIQVLYLTDVHIEPDYDTGSPTEGCGLPFCCRDEWGGTGGYALPWGDYSCNTHPRTVDAFLDFFGNFNLSYVLYTGDTPPNTVWLETQSDQINMSQIFVNQLADKLPGIPAYMTIGNHETFPTNLYYTERGEIQELMAALGSMWQPLGNLDQEQLDTLNEGGFYTILLQPGLRLLAYNSNFYATANYYMLLDQETNGYTAMQQFMEDTFNEARANGEKVMMLGHHLSGSGGTLREYSEFMTDIGRRNADLIVLHILGHSHSDSFKMNTDPVTGTVYDVQISGPSMNSQTEVNPSGKILYLHPDTFDVLEIETYYIDLQDPINNGSTAHIQLSHRFTEDYGTIDVTPGSFKDLVDRMETDEFLVAQYRYNLETRTGFERPCDSGCTESLLCDLRSTSYTQRQQCN